MAQILDLGKIRFNWAGTYSNTTQYEYNDLVKYGPNLYAFTAAAAATGVLPTNAGSWAVVVEGFNFRSTYVNGTLYYKNDVVTDGVSAFIATAQHTAADADINDNENFALLALGQSDLPSQLSAVNKVLSSDGTDTFWAATTYLTKGYWGSGQGQTAATIETSKALTNAVSVFATTATDFAQIAFTNTSNAADASTDFIAYTDTGNNASGFIDFGITSSGFADPEFTITGPNDGYIFMSAPRGETKAILLKQVLASVATLTTSGAHGWVVGNTVRVEGVSEDLDGEHIITAVPAANKFSYAAVGLAPFVETDVTPVGSSYRPVGEGNLVIATDASGLTNAIVFAAGGYYSNNTQMAIYPDQNVHIEIPTASTSPTTGALTVVGGVGVSGNVSTSGKIYGGVSSNTFETNAALTDTVAVFKGSTDSFSQIAFVNGTNDVESSADVIVYSIAGDNDAGWIDMGITNPAFDSTNYGITGAGDGYIFMSGVADKVITISSASLSSNVATFTTTAPHNGFVGDAVSIASIGSPFNGQWVIASTPTATTFTVPIIASNTSSAGLTATALIKGGNGNLVLATSDSGLQNRIVFAAGGLASGNEQMIIAPDQFVHIEIATASTSPTTGALIVAGGMGLSGDLNTLGNVSFEGFLFSGNDAENWATTTAALTNPVAVFRYDSGVETSSYAQVSFQNTDATSSTDMIVYMDNGSDNAGFWGFGIAGSNFDDTTYGITGPGDFYMFGDTVNDTYKGNMVFATGASGSENKIIFAAGGYASGNSQMVITPDQNIHIEIPTPSTSPTTGALTIVGGVGISGNMNVAGNVNISGTIAFGGGGTTVETENLAVTDPMIFVGTDNLTDALDLSFIGERAGATTLDPTASITTKALTSNVATLTITYGPSSEPFKVGDSVVVANVDATFNGTYVVTQVQSAPNRISYAKTAANVTSAPATTLTARNVTNKQLSSNVATLTTSSPHAFSIGESVTVTNVDATFNGAYVITGTPSATTFTYAKTGADVPSAPATTSYGTSVTQKSLTSNVATLTTSTSHTYLVGETVTVSSVDATFNGTYTISAVTSNTFSYGKVAGDIATSATSGSANVNRLEGVATAAQYLGTANSTDVFRPRFTGLSRDASDGGTYKLFDGLKTKPATTVDFADVNLTYAPLRVGALTATTVTASSSVTTPSITISGTPSAATDAATVQYVKGASNNWTIKTASYSAVNNDMIWANTTGGAFTITLPATPATNDRVRIGDVASKWDTLSPIVARNGSNIMGLAEDLTLNVKNAVVDLVYSGNATFGWRVI